MVDAVILIVFPLCLAVAALSDLFTMTIPNRVSAILLGSFIAIAPFSGLDFVAIVLHLGAGLLVFAFCFVLFGFNIMGGGDAKLLTASAVWFGWDPSLVEYLVYVSLTGGFLSLGIISLRAHTNSILAAGLPVPSSLLLAKKVPYGIAIGLAAFLAYPASPLMQAAFARLM